MMVKQLVMQILIAVSLAAAVSAAEPQKVPATLNELEKPYSLTRKDWLELSLPRFLQSELNTWSQKIEYNLIINDANQSIEVSLRCSNGSIACKFYVQESSETFKTHLENYLKRYDWARLLKVVVSVE